MMIRIKEIRIFQEKVLGALKDIPELIEKYDIQMVTIAIPSLSRKITTNLRVSRIRSCESQHDAFYRRTCFREN